jgi:hypothetical protein
MPIPKRHHFANQEHFTEGGEATLIGQLTIIEQDPAAGFLPANHREKDMVLELLDRHHPLKPDRLLPTEFLRHVAAHQGRLFTDRRSGQGKKRLTSADLKTRREESDAAKISIAIEWTDFLDNADFSVGALQRMSDVIADCPNPRAYLTEELGDDESALADAAILVRYIDGLKVREHGLSGEEDYDPLFTFEDRLPNPTDSRHKFLLDQYSLPSRERRPAAASHIDQAIGSAHIGPLRPVVEDALADQYRRLEFWEGIMKECERLDGVVRPVAETALYHLHAAVA